MGLDRVATREIAEDASEKIEEAIAAYYEFQDRMRECGVLVRSLGDRGRFLYDRVDAYPGWSGTRDAGAGVDMMGWLTEIEETLADLIDDLFESTFDQS